MRIRRLGPDDGHVLRDIRLRALLDAPSAFWTTYESEVRHGPDDWRRALSTAAMFVAEDPAGASIGVAGGVPSSAAPGVAMLISMWVAPEHRGYGVADALVGAVTGWALAERRPVVRLHVEEYNHRARRCYERLGFTLTGRRMFRERDRRWELEMQLDMLSCASGPA